MKIRTLIVDDEPLAREGIRLRLKEFPEIHIIGECSSGTEAVASMNKLCPELVFLDIQMPEMNGFEVLQQITTAPPPIIIFVTAYDAYAIKAFEFHAMDYLLKPIRDDRFQEAIRRVLGELQRRTLEQYTVALQSIAKEYVRLGGEKKASSLGQPSTPFLSQLMVKAREGITVLPVNQIEWIESAGDYVYVHANTQKHLVRETLALLEERLDPTMFIRIHRSTIINTTEVKFLRPTEHGDFDVYLQKGTKLKLSRTYRAHFEKLTGNTL